VSEEGGGEGTGGGVGGGGGMGEDEEEDCKTWAEFLKKHYSVKEIIRIRIIRMLVMPSYWLVQLVHLT